MRSQVKPLYATVVRNGLVATFYFQFIPFRSHYFDSPFKKYTVTCWLESLLVDGRLSLLVCGNLIAIDAPGYYFDTLPLNADPNNVLQEVVQRVQNLKPASITVIKDCDDNLFATLKQHGYSEFGTDLTMALTLNKKWNTFDDYLHALKHKYAQRARKLIRDAAAVDRRNIDVAQFTNLRLQFQRLFQNVTQRQSIRLLIPEMDYYEDLLRHDSRFSITGYFQNHQPVAFATYFTTNDETEMHYIGMDYSANERYHLYFNMMFDGIRKAIENKSHVLEMGRTARQAKVIVGAKPVYFNSALRFHNPLARWVFNTLRSRFAKKAGADWEPRHPFKSVEN